MRSSRMNSTSAAAELDLWRGLYRAFAEFTALAPWRWIGGEQLFAVEDPAGGDTGYCVVLGHGGETFGLSVFLGAEGFDGYRRLMFEEPGDPSAADELDDLEALSAQRALSAQLADREHLERDDRAIIKALGLKFRGRNAWPLFRSQRPGYLSWFLDRDEIRLLTAALDQAAEVATAVTARRVQLVDPLHSGSVFTRAPAPGGWSDAIREVPADPEPVAQPEAKLDEVRLRRLAQKGPPEGSWEIDVFATPAVVNDGADRPFQPRAMLAVTELGFVAGVTLIEPWLSVDERREKFVRMLESSPLLPAELLVAREETARLLEPVVRPLGIRIARAQLQALPLVRRALIAEFAR